MNKEGVYEITEDEFDEYSKEKEVICIEYDSATGSFVEDGYAELDDMDIDFIGRELIESFVSGYKDIMYLYDADEDRCYEFTRFSSK